jgi:hypothetical protein
LLPQALGVVEKWESWFLDFHFSGGVKSFV